MNKFWEWMEEKGYGYKGMYIQILDYGADFVEKPDTFCEFYSMKQWYAQLKTIIGGFDE